MGFLLSSTESTFSHFPQYKPAHRGVVSRQMSCFFSPRAAPTTSSVLPGHTQTPQVLFPQPPPNPQHSWLLEGCCCLSFPQFSQPVQRRGKSILEEAGSFTSLMPKKRMKQLVPAQWLMQTLQKILQTSPASYYLPGVLTVKSHGHIITFLKSQSRHHQELTRERNTWHPMHSCE